MKIIINQMGQISSPLPFKYGFLGLLGISASFVKGVPPTVTLMAYFGKLWADWIMEEITFGRSLLECLFSCNIII